MPKWFDNLSIAMFKTISRSNEITPGKHYFLVYNPEQTVQGAIERLVRRVKQTLKDVGINKNIFSSHSTRIASKNKAKT